MTMTMKTKMTKKMTRMSYSTKISMNLIDEEDDDDEDEDDEEEEEIVEIEVDLLDADDDLKSFQMMMNLNLMKKTKKKKRKKRNNSLDFSRQAQYKILLGSLKRTHELSVYALLLR